MRFGPPVGFARRPDGHKLAYQVLGDGDLDLVFLPGYASHLGLQWEEPSVAGCLHKLAAFSRLILLDRLGNGLSDRGPSGQSFEDDLDDVRLVLDTVGSQRTAFFGTHLGGRLALLFAATYPERTAAVVTFASHPASIPTRTSPGAPARRTAPSSWPPCGMVPMTRPGCWPGWPRAR
jgi:pimeloyl-ACP methyl ester carboxylesterase